MLLKILRGPAPPDLCIQALRKLQYYADLISAEDIKRMLVDMAGNSDFSVRLTSIKIIESRAESIFLPVLHQALNDEQEIRRVAAKALGKIGCQDSVKELIQAMTHRYDDIFIKNSIKALGEIGGLSAVNTLGDILVESENEAFQQEILEALGNSKSHFAVPFLLKVDFNTHESSSSWLELKRIKALGETASGALLSTLKSRLKRELKKDFLEVLFAAIASVQNRCKFYNYEVFGSVLPVKPQPTQQDTLTKIEQTVDTLAKTMSDQPTISITGGTFNAPLNLAPNQGHQPTTIIGTQNNYFGADDALLQQITDLQQFITELETQHPHIQTLPAAEAASDQAITYIQATNPSRWQTIRHQMHLLKRQLLNPDRHAQATKASLIEVTKKWCENSLIATAIITYIDKLSETPNQGA